MKIKLCWFCKHFRYENSNPSYHYSEYTQDSGNPFRIECSKKQWEFDSEENTQEQFAKCIMTASKCKKFEWLDKLQEVK